MILRSKKSMNSGGQSLDFTFAILAAISVVGVIIFQICTALDQKDRTGSFWGSGRGGRGGLFGGDGDEYVEPSISFFDHFPDVPAPEPANNVIGDKFSALKVGPFDAQICRQMVTQPSASTTGSFAVATIFSIKIIPVNSFAFQIDFPQQYFYARGPDSLAAFYESLSVNCAEPELLSLLQSDRFLAPLRALNALAAGSIARAQCLGRRLHCCQRRYLCHHPLEGTRR